MAANCYTHQVPAMLPNTADLDAATRTLQEATESFCRLQWRVQRIARGAFVDDHPEYELVEGDEIPTFAHVGELFAFTLDARSRLAEIASFLGTIEENLQNLDAVREIRDA